MRKGTLSQILLKVSSLTLVSRIMGFVRDIIMARYFGASYQTDAFFIAFKLPNLLRRIFAEGAFSQAFVPVLVEQKTKSGIEQTRNFISSVAGLLILSLVCITIIGILCAKVIILVTAPGFSHDIAKFTLAVMLLRITFCYILFISLASLVGSILNTWGNFTVPAFTPVILNIVWIIFALFLSKYFTIPIVSIAWAVLLGGALQLAFGLIFLRKIPDVSLKVKFDYKNSALWKVVRKMVPAIFAMSISQISLVINSIFASFLASGSISWMYYADRLMEFPTALLGTALGTILLPSLSMHATNGNLKEFSKLMDWGISLVLMLAIPAMVGAAIISKPMIMTLFMYGKFNLYDVLMTRNALLGYMVGLLGLIMVKIFAPAFYANQDIKTPVKIGIMVLVSNQIMNLIFIGPFKHAGLALAISLGACINASCLCYFLIKRRMYTPNINIWKLLQSISVSVIVMTFALKASLHLPFINFNGKLAFRYLSLSMVMLCGITAYAITLYITHLRREHLNR